MKHAINKSLCNTDHDRQHICRVALLHLIVLTVLASCIPSERYFTEEELDIVDVYYEGEQFRMLRSNGDTLRFTIAEKTLQKKKKSNCAECSGPFKYEELSYRLHTSTNGCSSDDCRIWVNTLSRRLYMRSSFVFDNNLIRPTIELDSLVNTIVINGKNYPNSKCEDGICFSSGVGFTKFIIYNDTLTLLP
jgi:hypothetical protein